MTEMPEAVAVTFEEGGEWWPFAPRCLGERKTVHSIQFSNGRVWDAVNGWRPLGGEAE